MKRNRLQRRVQAEVEELDSMMKSHLTFGQCLLDGEAFRDEAHRRAVWEQHGAEIIEDYVLMYPGRRPSAWWNYEAPEPRRKADGMILTNHGDWRRHHGCSAGDQGTQNKYETEPHYLRRLGLLGEDEAERLTDSAFSPVKTRTTG